MDSFQLLWEEICKTCKELRTVDLRSLTVKDLLVILGAIYAGSKFYGAAKQVYQTFKMYGLARCLRGDLVKRYGQWAGALSGRRPGSARPVSRTSDGRLGWSSDSCPYRNIDFCKTSTIFPTEILALGP